MQKFIRAVILPLLLASACSHRTSSQYIATQQQSTPMPSPNIPCLLPGNDSQTFMSVDDMAPEIKHELARRFGDPAGQHIHMAARDADFNVGDAVTDLSLSFRRFIQGGRVGTRWYVWYEHGGIGYGLDLAIFDLQKGDRMPQLVYFGPRGPLCKDTKEHLNDALGSNHGGPVWFW